MSLRQFRARTFHMNITSLMVYLDFWLTFRAFVVFGELAC